MVDHEAAKEQQRAFYAEGDYSWLSRLFMPAAEAIVEASGVRPGERVLDVAAGDGNVAVAAARRGATVTAVDLSSRQVESGRARTAAEGLDVEWLVGDAEALDLPDASFDHVLSVFGVMYAPRPDVVAAELFRVVTPGGNVGVVAWPPGGFNSRVYQAAKPFLPEELGADEGPDPDDWGDERIVRERLEPYARQVTVGTATIARRLASADEFFQQAAEHIPVMVALRGMLAPEDFATFGGLYRQLVEECSRPEGDGIVLEVPYTWALARAT